MAPAEINGYPILGYESYAARDGSILIPEWGTQWGGRSLPETPHIYLRISYLIGDPLESAEIQLKAMSHHRIRCDEMNAGFDEEYKKGRKRPDCICEPVFETFVPYDWGNERPDLAALKAALEKASEHILDHRVIWSVVGGVSPAARAIEPTDANLDIPTEILAWAIAHGMTPVDPDVYLLVTPADEAGEITNEIAHRTWSLSPGDMARLRARLEWSIRTHNGRDEV